jgi:hypothetical protein
MSHEPLDDLTRYVGRVVEHMTTQPLGHQQAVSAAVVEFLTPVLEGREHAHLAAYFGAAIQHSREWPTE